MIEGTQGMTLSDLHADIQRGGRFVVFEYCISILILTFRRSSSVQYLRAGEGAFAKGLPYTLTTLFLGWWGFPFGLIYTPMALITNLGGGKDVTQKVMESLG